MLSRFCCSLNSQNIFCCHPQNGGVAKRIEMSHDETSCRLASPTLPSSSII